MITICRSIRKYNVITFKYASQLLHFNSFLESRHRQFKIIVPQYNTIFPFNVGLYSYHLQYLIILHNLMSSESHYGHTKCLFQKQRQHCDTLEMTPSAYKMLNINFSQHIYHRKQLPGVKVKDNLPFNFYRYLSLKITFEFRDRTLG